MRVVPFRPLLVALVLRRASTLVLIAPPSVELVISAWRENLTFVDPVVNKVPGMKAHIYCCGDDEMVSNEPRCTTRIPNYGDENYAYLRHIVDNYEHGLAQITVFSLPSILKTEWGMRLCRKLNYVMDKIDTVEKQLRFSGFEVMAGNETGMFLEFDESFMLFAYRTWTNGPWEKLCNPTQVNNFGEWFTRYVDGDTAHAITTGVSFNGIFAVSRERIKMWPKSTYETLLHQFEMCGTDTSLLNDHFMERTWKPMFDHRTKAVLEKEPSQCPTDIQELILGNAVYSS